MLTGDKESLKVFDNPAFYAHAEMFAHRPRFIKASRVQSVFEAHTQKGCEVKL